MAGKTASKAAPKAAAKTGATKTAAKTAGKGSGERELIAPKGDKRYVRRNAGGEFAESDDQGKSLAHDVKQRAKTTVKSGHGDEGDQARPKSGAKKAPAKAAAKSAPAKKATS